MAGQVQEVNAVTKTCIADDMCTAVCEFNVNGVQAVIWLASVPKQAMESKKVQDAFHDFISLLAQEAIAQLGGKVQATVRLGPGDLN